jgi:hypothetical protein
MFGQFVDDFSQTVCSFRIVLSTTGDTVILAGRRDTRLDG